ncbi:MAG: hypothetical protein ACXABY_14390 [Candidatus Thorarchaeota archaeon]
MSTYQVLAGYTAGWSSGGGTYYWCPIGDLDCSLTEEHVQILIRDNYVIDKLWCRVRWNTCGGNTTVTTRINGEDSSLSLVIPPGATGVFQDTLNSEPLVPGDLLSIKTSSSPGDVYFTLMAQTITGYSFILASNYTHTNWAAAGKVYYTGIGGFLEFHEEEDRAKYIFGGDSRLSHLRIFVTENTFNGDVFLESRINGENGSQFIRIPAGAVGSFEDMTSFDDVLKGETVNYRLGATFPTSGLIRATVVQVEVTSVCQPLLEHKMTVNTGIRSGRTNYWAVQGNILPDPTEVRSQLDFQNPYIVKNLQLRVESNTINGDTVFRSRKNGDNGNLLITVPAGQTGVFQDLINSDLVDGELYNLQSVSEGTGGILYANILGIEIKEEVQPMITFKGVVSNQADEGEVVTVTVTSPTGLIFSHSDLTLADGSYSVDYDYTEPGDYTAQARIEEDAVYQAAESGIVPFTVTSEKLPRTITLNVIQ